MGVLRWVTRGLGVTVSLAIVTAGVAQAQMPSLVLGSRPRAGAANERTVFAKGSQRSMQINIKTNSLADTAHLAAQAHAVAVSNGTVAAASQATSIVIMFEQEGGQLPVAGVTRPDIWLVEFVRDASGDWRRRKDPPKKIELDVVPGGRRP